MERYAATAITTNRTGVPTRRATFRDNEAIEGSLMVPARDGSWLAVDIISAESVIYVLEMEN